MKLSAFKFDLPKESIAQHPYENRDDSRLMVINRAEGTIEHKKFSDLIDYIDEKDRLVFNDTKVFPARMYGNKEKTGAKIEVFLLRELNRENLLWDVLVDPARKIRIGNKLYFGEDDDLVAEVIDNTTSRGRTLRFLWEGSHEDFKQKIFELGETPLPKYIERAPEEIDIERFQTIYAKTEGAVAAPTAGLHFSKHLLKKLEIKGVDFSYVTLHTGLGAFRPVEVEDLTKHRMDSEEAYITQEAADEVNATKKAKGKICVVGTTALRTLESSVSADGYVKPFGGWTNKFIFPPFEFNIPDMFITNFHTPESTLLMMACAFGGTDLIIEAYKVALKDGYKFLAYGDAMLII